MTTTATKNTPGPWTYHDLAKAYAWYTALSMSGYAATLETVTPNKEWKVVRYASKQEDLILAERDRLRAENAELREALENFRSWHADHFDDFASDINAQLLCVANDAEAALVKANG